MIRLILGLLLLVSCSESPKFKYGELISNGNCIGIYESELYSKKIRIINITCFKKTFSICTNFNYVSPENFNLANNKEQKTYDDTIKECRDTWYGSKK